MSNSPYLSTLKPILRRMKTIKFSEEEISLLRNMYEDELAQAENYVDTIKDVLKKLGAPAKASNEISIDKEPKVKKRRGRKSKKAKSIEPKEPKKRGRPKKIVVPTPATELPKRRGRKPKISVPTPEKVESAVATPVAKKGIKKATPKSKKEKVAKVKAAKPIKKVEKIAATVESVVSSLLTTAPKKEVAKVVKKKAAKRRTKGFVRLAPLGKPLAKKVVDEPAPIEPLAPAEQS
jgi:hypothetical protein